MNRNFADAKFRHSADKFHERQKCVTSKNFTPFLRKGILVKFSVLARCGSAQIPRQQKQRFSENLKYVEAIPKNSEVAFLATDVGDFFLVNCAKMCLCVIVLPQSKNLLEV